MNEIYQYVQAHYDQLSSIGLAAIFLARLIAVLTPSPKDDVALGRIEKGFRKGISFLSGANHNDPSAPKAAAAIDEISDLTAFQRLLKEEFGAKLVIQPLKKEGE